MSGGSRFHVTVGVMVCAAGPVPTIRVVHSGKVSETQCTVVFVEVRFLCLLYSTLHDGILILIFMMMQNAEVALIYMICFYFRM